MTRRYLAGLCLPVCLAACATDRPGADIRTVSARSDLAMTADYRLVYRRSANDGKVLCAEPSPDIGRIVSAATSGSLTGSAKGLEKVQPEVALAFAASRAEGLTQLGQRLATIQLLRDSTYRACEAYANKAISAATYAMIVSRYDDVMVTLLLGEMASGAARAAPAALLTGTAATTGLSATTAESAVKLALARTEKASATLEADTKALSSATDADRAAKQQAVAASRKEFDDASSLLKAALAAIGTTRVATTGAAEGEKAAGAAAVAVATQLGAMQKSYLNDFNLDAVTVGCLSALSAFDWPPPATKVSGKSAATSTLPDAPSVKAAATSANDTTPEQARKAEGSALIPQGQGEANGASGRVFSFLSSTAGGAYSLQDECRAVLLNGQTLRGVAQARLKQVEAMTSNRKRSDTDTAPEGQP